MGGRLKLGYLLKSPIINNPSNQVTDRFGGSVAIHKSYIVVGAPNRTSIEKESGFVYLYNREGKILKTLSNPSPTSNGRFGTSVSISDPFILVGAPYDDFKAQNSGTAYLYTLVGNLTCIFRGPTAVQDGNFGYAVSINPALLYIGAPNHNSGKTYNLVV